jgi:hypothetical protein
MALAPPQALMDGERLDNPNLACACASLGARVRLPAAARTRPFLT